MRRLEGRLFGGWGAGNPAVIERGHSALCEGRLKTSHGARCAGTKG